MKFSQSIKPISYLKAHASDVIKSFDAGDMSTIIVTQNGEAKAVLLSITEYEQHLESLTLLKILMESRESLQEGKYQPASEAFDEIRERVKK